MECLAIALAPSHVDASSTFPLVTFEAPTASCSRKQLPSGIASGETVASEDLADKALKNELIAMLFALGTYQPI